MSEGNDANYFANAVGLIVDRTFEKRKVLASVWLLAENKVATTAESIQAFAQIPEALEVIFPSAGKRFAVGRIAFHPMFKRQARAKTVEQNLRDTGASKATKDHNCAVLYLEDKIETLTSARQAELSHLLSLSFAEPQQGLSGSLAEIEFSLLIQTLTNARKQGELVIVDERNYPIAQVFCDAGKILFARFRHLSNEIAIYQMVAQRLKNGFFFHSSKTPSWPVRKQIEQSTDVLMIDSYRRLDELERMRAEFGDYDLSFIRKKGEAELERLPAEWKEEARNIWCVADGLTTVSRLWHLVNFDDHTIFKVLPLLRQQDLIAASDSTWLDPASLDQDFAKAAAEPAANTLASILPLPVAPQLPLAPSDLLASIVVDGVSFRRGIKHGQLLGAIEAFDSYKLLHSLPMLPESAGCPIFKNGYVVAMHVGALPSNAEVSQPVLQQCIWVESVMECLSRSGESTVVKQLTQTIKPSVTAVMPHPHSEVGTPTKVAFDQAGCVEVANLDCPRCGLSSFHSAQFCENCNFELIPIEMELKDSNQTAVVAMLSNRPAKVWLTITAATVITLMIACLAAPAFLPKANLAEGPAIYLAEKPWLALSVKQGNPKQLTWELQPADKVFKNGDTIHLSIEVLKPCYVYLLHQTEKKAAELLIPQADQPGKQYLAGAKITYPEITEERSQGRSIRLIGITFAGEPGTEAFMCVASAAPLNLNNLRPALDQVSETTASVYRWGSFQAGFEIKRSTLEGGQKQDNLASTSDGADAEGKLVYVTRLIATHQK